MRSRKQELEPSPIQPGPLLCGSQPLPSTKTDHWGYSDAARTASIISPPSSPPTSRLSCTKHTTTASRESAEARERRIFGGEEGEGDSEELCGPMLDVVLGLFDGMDYDDMV